VLIIRRFLASVSIALALLLIQGVVLGRTVFLSTLSRGGDTQGRV